MYDADIPCGRPGRQPRKPRQPRIPSQRYARDRSGIVPEAAKVFVARDARGRINIGVSNDPYARVRSLQDSLDAPVWLVFEGLLEARAAAHFRKRSASFALADRSDGRDWFLCSEDEAIKAVMNVQVRR